MVMLFTLLILKRQGLMNKLSDQEMNEPQELSEDIEVIGPGQMLADGRKALGMSQENVAQRLNFRLSLVDNIENEIFDNNIPATFNRGYLRNFAKLVNVCEADVISSYEMLDVAAKQGAEMQSFSQNTKREAENSRIMWVSYLIIAIIIGSTLVWFFQEPPLADNKTSKNQVQNKTNTAQLTAAVTAKTSTIVDTEASIDTNAITNVDKDIVANEKTGLEKATSLIKPEVVVSENTKPEETDIAKPANILTHDKIPVTFFFKGDCWVNIYDATGEHIAWGVKKSGYVMNIEGIAPFTITLGKPERVSIEYNGNKLDMSQFNRGNIAKFTLPLVVN